MLPRRSSCWPRPLKEAPDPDRAARLTKAQITAALRRARRRDIQAKTAAIKQALAADQLRRSAPVTSAYSGYAAIVTGQVAVVATLNTQISQLATVVAEHFGRHPDAEIYTSQPGPTRARCDPRRPGPGRVRRRPAPLRRRQGTQEPRRPTPAPHRSPKRRAARRSSSPGTPATNGSPTHSSNGPPAPYAARPEPRPTTTTSATAGSATTPPPGRSPTDSSASSTAA